MDPDSKAYIDRARVLHREVAEYLDTIRQKEGLESTPATVSAWQTRMGET